MTELTIIDLQPENIETARQLILAGLQEHWGWLDKSLNPDLQEIGASYAAETFLIAFLDGRLVGTGALIREEDGVGRVVRMSVAKDLRRAGIGRSILEELRRRALQRGFTRLVLETTETWQDAIAFYLRFGFRLVEHRDGDAHFILDLAGEQAPSTHGGETGL